MARASATVPPSRTATKSSMDRAISGSDFISPIVEVCPDLHREPGYLTYISAIEYETGTLTAMSTFEHTTLIHNINENLAPLRKAQPEAMQGFGQLAKASMAEGAISAKNKELIALAIGITQHCSGCVGFHVKALHRLQCTRTELEEMLTVCVYMGGGPALMYAAEALNAWDAMAPK
jgi:AhpD family alkylhydroperoxidase